MVVLVPELRPECLRQEVCVSTSNRSRMIGVAVLSSVCVPAILLGQNGMPAPACYNPVTYPGTQSGPCSAYCECPGRTLCAAPNGTSVGGAITMTALACTDYTGGTSVGGRCVGGTPTGLPAACGPAVVAVQACPPDCEGSGGGA